MLAGEGGAHEVRGFVRRETNEDILEKVVWQGRWRRHYVGGGGEGFCLGGEKVLCEEEGVVASGFAVRFGQPFTSHTS